MRPRTIVAQSGAVWFAPHRFAADGIDYLIATGGSRDELDFEDRQWPSGRIERWYVGGANRLFLGAVGGDSGAWARRARPVRCPRDTADLMGASWCRSDSRDLLYFSARNSAGPWRIFVAEGHLATCSWDEPQCVLAPSVGSESEHVYLPSVLHDDRGWWMWYAARDGRHRRIHCARSLDGVEWHREGLVLDCGPPGNGDAYAADCPSVLRLATGYLMVYGAGTARNLHAAYSADGLTWRKLGVVRTRGGPGTPDSQYAFYPALWWRGDEASLVYAGEDDGRQWSILDGGVVDLPHLLRRRAPDRHAGRAAARLMRELPAIDSSFFEEPADAHGMTPGYRSADGNVRQLRPSSTPVFAVEDGGSWRVVKLGRSAQQVEREHLVLQMLADYLPVPQTEVQYFDDRPVLAMPFIDGTALPKLLPGQPERARCILGDVVRRFCRLGLATLRPYEAGHQSEPAYPSWLLADWLRERSREDWEWLDAPLVANAVDLGTTARTELAAAAETLDHTPGWLTLFTGDNHLGNILAHRAGSTYTIVDAEFGGMIDLDYSVAEFISSVVKHSGLLHNATVDLGSGALRARFDVLVDPLDLLRPAHLGPGPSTIREIFAPLPVDLDRMRAYATAKLHFRLASPDGRPPAFGVAALGLTVLMCREGTVRA